MQQRRLDRVFDRLEDQPPGSIPQRLCSAAAQTVGLPGAGIALVHDGLGLQSAAAHGLGVEGEQLQFTLGIGVVHEAYLRGEPSFADDLTSASMPPALGTMARQGGIAAMFGFPLRSGASPFGTFTLYGSVPGPLSREQHLDALAAAKAMATLLTMARTPAGEAGRDDGLEAPLRELHEAMTMTCDQLDVPPADAMAALRGRAYATGRSITDVADDIVARRRRFGLVG